MYKIKSNNLFKKVKMSLDEGKGNLHLSQSVTQTYEPLFCYACPQ